MSDGEIERLARQYPAARMTMRVILEFAQGIAADLSLQFDGYPDLGMAFVTLLRSTNAIDRLDAVAALRSVPPGAISISALAAALQRPFETVRKHVHTLAADGWCALTSRGLTVLDAALDRPATRRMIDDIHDRLVGVIVDLQDLDYAMPEARAPAIDHPRLNKLAVEFYLKACETAIVEHGGWLPAYIFLAVMMANARPLTFDRTLAGRFAGLDTPPPESERTPVDMGHLALALHLPYSTVRRHVAAQIRMGRIVRRDGGLMVPVSQLQVQSSLLTSGQLNVRLNQLLVQAAAAGFPFADPTRAYRRHRPPLLDFGHRASGNCQTKCTGG